MDELLAMLEGLFPPSPKYHDRELLDIRLMCGFEPNGRASETWEYTWTLVFPQILHHWHSTTGWRPGNTELVMEFHGETVGECIAQARNFLLWYQERGQEHAE